MASSTNREPSSWQHDVSIPRVASGSLSPSHQCSVSTWPDSDADNREAFLRPSSTSSAPSSPTHLTTHRRAVSGSTNTPSGSISIPRVVPVPLDDRFPSHHHAALTWGHSNRHWRPHRPKLWFSCLSLVFFTALVILNMKADSLERYTPQPKPIAIPLKPAELTAPPPDPNERFLGYLPHSGFHNQRGELQNALLLAKALNRTLLLPPIWLGWPVPTHHYEDLAMLWTSVMLVNSKAFGIDSLVPDSELNEPGLYPSTLEDFPFPTSKADDAKVVQKAIEQKAFNIKIWKKKGYEVRKDGYPITNLTSKDCKSFSAKCRHTYKDTFLAWSSLVNLTVLHNEVKLRDRWDMRERAIEEMLNVTKDDIYVFKDRQSYDFQFVEQENEDGALIRFADNPLKHWARNVSILGMRRMSQRVLLLGSVFGHDRVLLQDNRQRLEDKKRYALSLAFRMPEILIPADDICQRLGGAGTFIGIHARVGDGNFAEHRRGNMRFTWRSLLIRLGVRKSERESLWHSWGFERAPATTEPEPGDAEKAIQPNSRALNSAPRKHSRTSSKEGTPPNLKEEHQVDLPHLERRQFRPDLIDHDAFYEAAFATKLDRLTCRSPLHTSPELLKFNVPLYLATDSLSPLNEPSLSPFFKLFPCIFLLSDFEEPNELNMGIVVDSLDRFKRLTNEADGLPLKRFFTPFLEAVVAAKAGVVVGTRGSTFSGKSDRPGCYAQTELHEAYAKDRA